MAALKVVVKKIYKSKVDIRDYRVLQALKKRVDIIVLHDGQKMTIPYGEIGQNGDVNRRTIIGKFDGRPYRLISFDWVPDKEE